MSIFADRMARYIWEKLVALSVITKFGRPTEFQTNISEDKASDGVKFSRTVIRTQRDERQTTTIPQNLRPFFRWYGPKPSTATRSKGAAGSEFIYNGPAGTVNCLPRRDRHKAQRWINLIMDRLASQTWTSDGSWARDNRTPLWREAIWADVNSTWLRCELAGIQIGAIPSQAVNRVIPELSTKCSFSIFDVSVCSCW